MNLPQLRHSVVPAESVRANAGVLSIFNEQTRTGDWVLPREMRVVAVFGSVTLDLREARIGEGRSVIKVIAMAASVEIIIPPGVGVEVDGDAFMGTFSYQHDSTVPLAPNAPVIVLTGMATMGSVEAEVRYPGEKSRQARRRIRATSQG